MIFIDRKLDGQFRFYIFFVWSGSLMDSSLAFKRETPRFDLRTALPGFQI